MDGAVHPFLWQNARLADLGRFDAHGVNNRNARHVLWQERSVSDLTIRGVDADAFLTPLNNRGDLAGGRNGHAVLYRR